MKKNFLLIFFIASILLVSACTTQSSSTGSSNQGYTGDAASSGDTSSTGDAASSGDTSSTGDAASSGDTSSTPDEIKTINVESYNFGFKITGPEINKGDKVKLILTSTSGTHGFALPAFGVNLGPISPGQEKSTEFVADQSGSFDYYCNVACGVGHRSMNGQFIVN